MINAVLISDRNVNDANFTALLERTTLGWWLIPLPKVKRNPNEKENEYRCYPWSSRYASGRFSYASSSLFGEDIDKPADVIATHLPV